MSSAALWDSELARVKRRLEKRRERQAEHEDSVFGRIRAHLAFKDQQQELGEVDEWVAADGDGDHDMGLDFLQGVDEEDMRTLLNEEASRMQPEENGPTATDQVQLQQHSPIPMPESLISPTKATVSSAEITAIDMDVGGDLHLQSATRTHVAVSVSLGDDTGVTELLNELQLDLGSSSALSSNSSNTTTSTASTSIIAPVMTNDNSRPAWQARSGQQPANHASAPTAKAATAPAVLQQETQRTEHDAVGAEMVSWVSGYRDPEVVRRKENTPQRNRRSTMRYGVETYQEQLSVRRAAKYYAQESDHSSDSSSPDSAGSDFAMEEEPEDIARLDDEPLSEIELLSDDYLNRDDGSKRKPRRRRRLRKGVASNVSPQVNKARQPRQTRRPRRKQLVPTKHVGSNSTRLNERHAPQVMNTEKAIEGQSRKPTEQSAGKQQEQTIDLRSTDDEDTVVMGRLKNAHFVDPESTSNTDDSSVSVKNPGQIKPAGLQKDKDSLILRLKTPKSFDSRTISTQSSQMSLDAENAIGDGELSDTGTLVDDENDAVTGTDEELRAMSSTEISVGITDNLAIHIPQLATNVDDEYLSDTGTVVDYEDLSEAGTEGFDDELICEEPMLEVQSSDLCATKATEFSFNSAHLSSRQLSTKEKMANTGLTANLPAANATQVSNTSKTEDKSFFQAKDIQETEHPSVNIIEKATQAYVEHSGDVSDAETVDLEQVDDDDLGLNYSDDEDEDGHAGDQLTEKQDENDVEQFDFDGSASIVIAKVKTATSELVRPAGVPKPKTIALLPTKASETRKPAEKASKTDVLKKKTPASQTIGSNGLRKRVGNSPVETTPVTKGNYIYNRRTIKVLGTETSDNQKKAVETISVEVTSPRKNMGSENTKNRYLGYGKQLTGTEDDSLDDEPLARSTAPKSKYGGGGFDPPTQIPRDSFERRAKEVIELELPKVVHQFIREPQLSVYQALHLPEREESATCVMSDDHKRPTKFIKSQEDKKKRGIAFVSNIPIDLEKAPIPKKPKAKVANASSIRYVSASQENSTNRGSGNKIRRDCGDRDRYQGGTSRTLNENNKNDYSSKRSSSRRERSPSPENRRNGYKSKKNYASRPQKLQKNSRSFDVHDKYGPTSRSPPRSSSDRNRDFRDSNASFKDRRQSYDDRKRSRSNSHSRSARNDREDNRGRKPFLRESEWTRDQSRSPQTCRQDDSGSYPQKEDRPQSFYEKATRSSYDNKPRDIKKVKLSDPGVSEQERDHRKENDNIRPAPVVHASMDQDEYTFVESDIDDDEIMVVEDESAQVTDIRFDLSNVPVNESECDKCVYVTGINFSMDEDVLNEVFEPFGVQVRRQCSTCFAKNARKWFNFVCIWLDEPGYWVSVNRCVHV